MKPRATLIVIMIALSSMLYLSTEETFAQVKNKTKNTGILKKGYLKASYTVGPGMSAKLVADKYYATSKRIVIYNEQHLTLERMLIQVNEKGRDFYPGDRIIIPVIDDNYFIFEININNNAEAKKFCDFRSKIANKNKKLSMLICERTINSLKECSTCRNKKCDECPTKTAPTPKAVTSPSFSPKPETYQSTQAVKLSCDTTGASIRYTTNGGEPTENSLIYNSPISASSTMIIKAKAYKRDWTPSTIATGRYIITGTIAIPKFSPKSGKYPSAQTIKLSCDTSGAVIRYTTNGAEPTEKNSLIYELPISVSSSKIIKARAYKSGWKHSNISTETYTIAGQQPEKTRELEKRLSKLEESQKNLKTALDAKITNKIEIEASLNEIDSKIEAISKQFQSVDKTKKLELKQEVLDERIDAITSRLDNLKIAKKARPLIKSGSFYTVQKNDILGYISSRAYGTCQLAKCIYKANENIIPSINLIIEGMTIKIPKPEYCKKE